MIDCFKLKTKNTYQLLLSNCHSESGFTIIEMLLYMGIFSILLTVLMQVFSGILATHAESQATSSVNQDGSFILARFAYDIHSTSSITSPTVGSSCTWPVDSNCQLVLGTGAYSINSGDLKLNGTDQLNSINTKVKSITFTTLGNTAAGSKPSVQIVLTLESTAIRQGGIKQQQTFQTTVGTR